jgi:hypothetical protein
MISWNEFDAQFSKHNARVERGERFGWMTTTPVEDRQRRIGLGAIFGSAAARAGAVLIELGRWLSAGERGVEVG